MGNSLYGQVVTGLNNKRNFNSRLGIVIDNSFGPLTNPIMGQAISGFVRATLSEALLKIEKLGGKVISCTTDGFITNLGFETFNPENIGSITDLFITSFNKLVGKSEVWELAYEGIGLISWKTRGQLGLGDSKLSAITGFNLNIYHNLNVRIY